MLSRRGFVEGEEGEGPRGGVAYNDPDITGPSPRHNARNCSHFPWHYCIRATLRSSCTSLLHVDALSPSAIAFKGYIRFCDSCLSYCTRNDLMQMRTHYFSWWIFLRLFLSKLSKGLKFSSYDISAIKKTGKWQIFGILFATYEEFEVSCRFLRNSCDKCGWKIKVANIRRELVEIRKIISMSFVPWKDLTRRSDEPLKL